MRQVGPCLLDQSTGAVSRDGQPVPLRPMQKACLVALVAVEGGLITYEALGKIVWKRLDVPRQNIAQMVNVTRKHVGFDLDAVRGLGYRLPRAEVVEGDHLLGGAA